MTLSFDFFCVCACVFFCEISCGKICPEVALEGKLVGHLSHNNLTSGESEYAQRIS